MKPDIKRGNFKISFNIALILLVILAFSVRVLNIEHLPYGLHIDEVGMAYDAWNLAYFGTDRYLDSWPIYLTNFGVGQSSFYAFCCAGLIRLFGVSPFVIRFPAILFGCATVCFGGLIVKEIKGEIVGLLTAFLLATLPYFIMSSRFALDCNLFLGVSTIALYLMIKAVKTKRQSWAMLAGTFFGLTLYTYALSYFVLAGFLSISLIGLLYFKKIKWKQVFWFSIPFSVLALPLIFMILVNMNLLPEFQLGIFSINKLPLFRVNEFGFDKLFLNVKKIFDCLFFEDGLNYNSSNRFGTLHFISIPFVFWGMGETLSNWVQKMMKKRWSYEFFIILWFICIFFVSLTLRGSGPNINKINGIYFVVVYFLSNGLWTFLKFLNERVRIMTIIGVYTLCFGGFISYYFGAYTNDQGMLSFFSIYPKEIVAQYPNRPVYIESKYIYMVLEEKIPAKELEFHYLDIPAIRNVHFGLPAADEMEENAVVVVNKDNSAWVEYYNAVIGNNGMCDDRFCTFQK